MWISNALSAFASKHQKNPADAASGYYKPYIQQGQNALNKTYDEYGNLITDPGSRLNQIGQGYQHSPGYQHEMDAAMAGANNAYAAGGMAGTPAHAEGSAQIAGDVANKDYQQWLSNALGLYQNGLGGMSHISDQGYNASNEMGHLAYGGAQAKNLADESFWGNIAGAFNSGDDTAMAAAKTYWGG